MWWANALNQKAITGTFPNGVPQLLALAVVECILSYPRDLLLNLEVTHLPDSSPQRWRNAGYDRLQYRFRFRDFTDLKIAGDLFDAPCDVFISDKRLELRFTGGVAALKTNFGLFDVTFEPYARAKADRPPVFVR